MKAIICMETCEPYAIGPFGVREYYGSGVLAEKGKIYYANTCSKSEYYYVAAENYGIGNPAHTHYSFMGVYESKNFEDLAGYREKQIDSILSN